MEIISNQDIQSRYPSISFHIHVYPCIYSYKIPYSYLPKLSNVYPVYSLLSSISRENIPNDIHLLYPGYVQIYPFVSNKISLSDILGVILFGYPEISFLSLAYPEKISMMICNYDILVISKYIHVYPI
jgi:hypothetical protein